MLKTTTAEEEIDTKESEENELHLNLATVTPSRNVTPVQKVTPVKNLTPVQNNESLADSILEELVDDESDID